MSNESPWSNIVSQFKSELTKESETSLEGHLNKYKKQLKELENANKKLLDESIIDYGTKREKLHNNLNNAVNKMSSDVEKKINGKVNEATQEMETRLSKVYDELFHDPNKLYQQIVNATKELKNQRSKFEDERKKWDKNDKRCAAWLGISYDINDEMKHGYDNEEEPANNERQRPTVNDDDFIVIKVDDKTFRTYRGTLTQVKDSFIAKLFGPHSDLIYRDSDNAYCLNCNPEVFSQVLEILRRRGTVTQDFKMSHTLYAALMEYGLLDVFFPSYSLNGLGLGLNQTTENQQKKYHVIFESWRSTVNESNYIRWNVSLISNVKRKNNSNDHEDGKDDEKNDEEKKDIDVDEKISGPMYWKLNPSDNSELIIETAGYYRIVFRCSIQTNTAVHARIYVNGSGKGICRHYNESSSRYKSYNFNDIRQHKQNDKIKLYVSVAACTDAITSYLCIERIPDGVLRDVGIWTSSASDGNYRQWNSVLKAPDKCTLSNSNKNINFQSGGLYRVSARIHTYCPSAGSPYTYMYEYRNGNNHSFYNYQSNNNSSAQFECHMYDKIVCFKKGDYVNIYDNGYKNYTSVDYDSICVQPITFPHLIGHWGSSSVKDTYLRVWNCELWGNDILFGLDGDKVKIKVNERGYYRISVQLTNYQGNEEGHSSLYINDTEYAKSQMGCYTTSTLYHTISIQEIVLLKEGETFHLYSSKPYSGSNYYNQLWIEKLL